MTNDERNETVTETDTPAGKRGTWRQAAIAGVALTAIIGGLLAVDVVNRPEQQVDCAVDLRDMGDDGDGTGGLANFGDPRVADTTWTQEDLRRAKDAFRAELGRREAEKLAAGCTEPLPFRI
ncbi:hypothetical protein [Mycobacteroides abscessus]|uniref:hypothetical protein n=1 Tax=Mycobacteroides abscessus TaxID=36809 RepID=UPI0009288D20|nr:hypothetical protein [Mycobacteroides abscessus]SIF35822.1 Uncharacterised protein [Mycobacteroides abscessus subsp. abscessus]